MSENPMTAIDYEALGKLVKSWALDKDRVMKPDPDNTRQNLIWPRPASSTDPEAIEALRQQFLAAGTNYTIPDEVTELVVVQSSRTRFVLKLPSAEAVLASEARLENDAWSVPDFYTDVVMSSPSVEDKLKFDDQRIGDYTIANCAG